jgi:hypothetical protein
MAAKYLESFYTVAESMLKGLEVSYPGDIPVKMTLAKFNTSIKHIDDSRDKFIRRWWELTKPHQQIITDGNLPAILQTDIPLIDLLDVRAKAKGMSKQSQANLLKFIQVLTECSRIYTATAHFPAA